MRKPEYGVKVLDGPTSCGNVNGVEMVMYRFVCSQPHLPPSKVTVYMTRMQEMHQPDAVGAMSEQLVWVLSHGGRLTNYYSYSRGGMLRPASKI